MIALSLLLACHRDAAAPAEDHHQDLRVEDHAVRTEDGATITLHRHVAEGPPALVVHGISSNHNSWDLSEDRSLASYLAEQGIDAWLLDLRGHGAALTNPEGQRQWGGWSMDDYGARDIPAAVAWVSWA